VGGGSSLGSRALAVEWIAFVRMMSALQPDVHGGELVELARTGSQLDYCVASSSSKSRSRLAWAREADDEAGAHERVDPASGQAAAALRFS
jgi:hypothetical protein